MLNFNCKVFLALIAILFPGGFCAYAADTTIKVAVVMPEGSTPTNVLHQLSDHVQKETKGEVSFKIYAGGISGDEPDVIRKMRANRIQAAGFSGIGLGLILPEIRILESVLLFDTHGEIDTVKEALFDHFAAQFEKKGYVLLGFFEAGFTYIYAKKPLNSSKDFQSLKMWAWKGDKVAEQFFRKLSVPAFPLPVTDVNTGLETGMINGFYSPPLAAIALQWYDRVEYMLDYPLVDSNGAFLMNKRAFYRLTETNQKILKDSVRNYCQILVDKTRKENAEAKAVIKESGVKVISPTEELIAFLKAGAQEGNQANIPALYSRELFDQVKKIIAETRENPS